MGRREQLRQIEENQRKLKEEIFVNGKMVNKLNFNPIDEIYKEGKHEKWFKKDILCIYADGTMLKQLKNETGAICYMALHKGELIFAEFETSEDPKIIKLDSVGFEELAIIKALKKAESLGYKEIIFFHDCITVQDDAAKRKYKKGLEFPLQWEFFDTINAFDGKICFQKISSKENPYHNIVDKTLRATKSYIEYAARGKGEQKKLGMLEFLREELVKQLESIKHLL